RVQDLRIGGPEHRLAHLLDDRFEPVLDDGHGDAVELGKSSIAHSTYPSSFDLRWRATVTNPVAIAVKTLAARIPYIVASEGAAVRIARNATSIPTVVPSNAITDSPRTVR